MAAIASAALSLTFKLFWPELPFMDRVGLVFLLCVAIGFLWSLVWPQAQTGYVDPAGVSFSRRAVLTRAKRCWSH